MINSTLLVLFVSLIAGSLVAQPSADGSGLLSKARTAVASQQYSKAIQQLNEALSADPTAIWQPDARLLLARAYLESRNPEAARRESERIIREYPAFQALDSVFLVLATATRSLGQPGVAADLLDQLSRNYPLSYLAPAALKTAADLVSSQKNYPEARRLYSRLINEYPNVPEQIDAQFELGNLLYFLDEYESARQRFQSILNHPSASSDQLRSARIRLADIYLSLKDPGSAADLLKSLPTDGTDDQSLRARLLSAQIAIMTNQWETGLPEAERLLAAMKLDPVVFTRYALFMARTYHRLQKLTESAIWYDRVMEQAQSEVRQFQARVEAATVQDEAGNLPQALKLITTAMEQWPDLITPRSLILKSSLQRKSGQFQAAVDGYRQFLKRFPTHPDADRVRYEAAVVTSDKLGIRSQAIDLLTPLLAADQQSAFQDDAAWLTGLLYLESGFTGDAFRIWDAFPVTFPGSEYLPAIRSIQDTLTVSRLNNRDFAARLATLVTDLDPGNPKGTIQFAIGNLIYSTGLYLTTAADYLKLSLETTDLTPAQREEALRLSALIQHQLGNDSESLRLIQDYQKEFANQPAASALQTLFLTLKIERTALAELPSLEPLIGMITVSDQRVLLRLAMINRQAKLDPRVDRQAALVALSTAGTSAETAGTIRRALADLYLSKADTTSAIRIWQELGQSGWLPDVEWGLSQLIRTGTRYFPVTDRLAYLTAYLDRFYYSGAANQARTDWLETALAAGKTDLAASWCQQFVSTDRLFPDDRKLGEIAFYIRAKAIQQTDPTGSITLFREYIDRFPDGLYLPEVYRSMALIAKQAGDLELAASYYKLSNVYSFGKTGSSMEIAMLYYSNGDYKQAIREFSALQRTATLAELIPIETRIISSYYRLQNPVLAEKMTALLVAKNPPVDVLAELQTERADYLIGQQRYGEAISVIDGILKQYPGSVWIPRARLKQCKALELDGKSDQAVTIYQELIRNYPASDIISDVYLSLGNYYFRKEAYDKAITNYKIIIDRYPTPVDRYQSALNNLIIAYEKYGFYDRALEDLKAYIDRFPNDSEILDKKIKVGILLQKTGNFQQSVTYLSQLLQGTSGSLQAEITYYLGETWYAKGEYDKAIDVFTSIESIKKATDQLDWVTSGHYMAGQSYEKLGNREQALVWYQKIVKRPGVDPIFKKAAQKEINRLKGN